MPLMYRMRRSWRKVLFVTYHGASVMIRRNFDWNNCILAVTDGLKTVLPLEKTKLIQEKLYAYVKSHLSAATENKLNTKNLLKAILFLILVAT